MMKPKRPDIPELSSKTIRRIIDEVGALAKKRKAVVYIDLKADGIPVVTTHQPGGFIESQDDTNEVLTRISVRPLRHRYTINVHVQEYYKVAWPIEKKDATPPQVDNVPTDMTPAAWWQQFNATLSYQQHLQNLANARPIRVATANPQFVEMYSNDPENWKIEEGYRLVLAYRFEGTQPWRTGLLMILAAPDVMEGYKTRFGQCIVENSMKMVDLGLHEAPKHGRAGTTGRGLRFTTEHLEQLAQQRAVFTEQQAVTIANSFWGTGVTPGFFGSGPVSTSMSYTQPYVSPISGFGATVPVPDSPSNRGRQALVRLPRRSVVVRRRVEGEEASSGEGERQQAGGPGVGEDTDR